MIKDDGRIKEAAADTNALLSKLVGERMPTLRLVPGPAMLHDSHYYKTKKHDHTHFTPEGKLVIQNALCDFLHI